MLGWVQSNGIASIAHAHYHACGDERKFRIPSTYSEFYIYHIYYMHISYIKILIMTEKSSSEEQSLFGCVQSILPCRSPFKLSKLKLWNIYQSSSLAWFHGVVKYIYICMYKCSYEKLRIIVYIQMGTVQRDSALKCTTD